MTEQDSKNPLNFVIQQAMYDLITLISGIHHEQEVPTNPRSASI